MGNACRPLNLSEIHSISQAFAGRFANRHRAVFWLGLFTGFRVQELLSIRLGWMFDYPGRMKPVLTIPKEFRKGKKRSHTVKLNSAYLAHLKPWLDEVESMGFIHRDCYLFCQVSGKPVHRKRYLRTLQAAATRAMVYPTSLGTVGTHSMRKTFVKGINEQNKQKYGEDAPIMTQKIVGHAKLESTIAYLPSTKESLDDSVDSYIGVLDGCKRGTE